MFDSVDSFTNPIEIIRKEYNSLSRTQKKIADLLLERGDVACFLSLNDLSDMAGVTAVTVVKFAKKLGYDNFSDLKKDLQNYVQSMISPRSVVKSDLQQFDNLCNTNTIQRIIESELSLMSETYNSINKDSIIGAVRLILSARKIYLAAKGLTIPVAETLLTRLNFLCIESELIKMDNINLLPRRILHADEQDVFIVFSFPNYTQAIGEIAKCAKHLGSKVICITDKTTSPPSCYSDIILLCHTSSLVFYNSMTVPLSVVNIIATLLAIELKDRLAEDKPKIKQLASFFEDKRCDR